MKKLLFIFGILILMQITAIATTEDADNWIKVVENNFIDPKGIVGTTDRYGYTFLLKSYNKGQYEPVEGHLIAYTISQYTIDCDKYLYKIGVMDSYGRNNNYITGDYNKYAQFQPIVSDTAVWTIAQKLCKIKTR